MDEAASVDGAQSFDQAGAYTVWVRGWAENGGSDSVHIGLDGQEVASGTNLRGFGYGAWTWRKGTLVVASAGTHTVDVWMREDGFRLDRLVLTTDAGYVPSGTGPIESARTDQITPVMRPLIDSALVSCIMSYTCRCGDSA